MRTLAIDTATEACSAALFDDGKLLAGFHEILGRGHAERLVPMIAELPDSGRADRVLVSLGPGSFTGTRIGLAAARALGFAWNAPVTGYPTLALVAAMARAAHPDAPATVCMTGGHGEWFVQEFGAAGQPVGAHVAIASNACASLSPARLIAGSKARELAQVSGPDHIALDILPDARQALLVPDNLYTADLSPIYGRPPDAKLPGAR